MGSEAFLMCTLVLFFPIEGYGQDQLKLFSNNSNNYVCPGQDILYACLSNSSGVRWIVPQQSVNVAIIRGIVQQIGPLEPIGNILITVHSVIDISSTLIVKSDDNLTNTTVECRADDGTQKLFSYIRADEVRSPANLRVIDRVSCSNGSNIVVEWNRDPDILSFMLNCTMGECLPHFFPANATHATIYSMSNGVVNVSVRAEGRCASTTSYIVADVFLDDESKDQMITTLTITTAIGWSVVFVESTVFAALSFKWVYTKQTKT